MFLNKEITKFSYSRIAKGIPAITLVFFWSFGIQPASAQRPVKTIDIEEVRILGNEPFQNETAGQKDLKIDSLVFQDKINSSLSELLAENTTIYIKEHGRGALATASFRGTAPSHTQVFWNGMNINSPMLGMVDFSLIPVHIIDNMSLQHGGSSISQQSGGLGGSININNQADWQNRFSWKYSQGIGSFASYDEYGQLNLGTSKFQSKTRLYHNYSENAYAFTNTLKIEEPEEKNENADYQKHGITQEFYLRPDDNNYLSIKGWWQDAGRSIPTVLSYEGDNQSNLNNQQDNTYKFIGDWSHYRPQSKYQLSAGFDHHQLLYQLENKVSGTVSNTAIYSQSNMSSFHGKFHAENKFSNKFELLYKVDYSNYKVATKDTVINTGYAINRNELSVFGGLNYQAIKNLRFSLMLRNDWIGFESSPLIYNIGASYKPFAKENLILKASFARNYHHPSLNDLYWQPGGNPNLKPEEGYTGEFSLQYLKNHNQHQLQTAFTGYYSNINNWIIWLPSFKGFWEPFNIRQVKSYGLEYNLKLTTEIRTIKIQLQGNYGLTKSLNFGDPINWGDESYGKQLPFIPVHSGNFMGYVSYKKYYIRYQFNSYSERYRMTSNKVGLEDDSESLTSTSGTTRMNWHYPYYMNNMALGREFAYKQYRLDLELKINNLFHEEYRSILGRYMPGRNFMFRLLLSYNK